MSEELRDQSLAEGQMTDSVWVELTRDEVDDLEVILGRGGSGSIALADKLRAALEHQDVVEDSKAMFTETDDGTWETEERIARRWLQENGVRAPEWSDKGELWWVPDADPREGE